MMIGHRRGWLVAVIMAAAGLGAPGVSWDQTPPAAEAPAGVRLYLSAARRHLANKDYAQARMFAEKVIKLAPGTASAKEAAAILTAAQTPTTGIQKKTPSSSERPKIEVADKISLTCLAYFRQPSQDVAPSIVRTTISCELAAPAEYIELVAQVDGAEEVLDVASGFSTPIDRFQFTANLPLPIAAQRRGSGQTAEFDWPTAIARALGSARLRILLEGNLYEIPLRTPPEADASSFAITLESIGGESLGTNVASLSLHEARSLGSVSKSALGRRISDHLQAVDKRLRQLAAGGGPNPATTRTVPCATCKGSGIGATQGVTTETYFDRWGQMMGRRVSENASACGVCSGAGRVPEALSGPAAAFAARLERLRDAGVLLQCAERDLAASSQEIAADPAAMEPVTCTAEQIQEIERIRAKIKSLASLTKSQDAAAKYLDQRFDGLLERAPEDARDELLVLFFRRLERELFASAATG